MVAQAGVFLAELPAIVLALGDVVDAAIGVEHRHALLGEADVVRAVEIAGGRVLVRLDPHAARPQHGVEPVLDLRAAIADDEYVLGFADRLDRVDVDARDRFLQRDERRFRIVGGAQQPAFFCRHSHEDGRALRRARFVEGLADLDDRRSARRIVDRAVIDVVLARSAVSQMVPMGHVEDIFVRVGRSANAASDIGALHGRDCLVDGRVE